MAAKKRQSTRSNVLNRAVKAGRSALREAERRVPPDVRKQLERSIQDGQKTLHAAIKQVQVRLDRTARQADLERAMKGLEALSQQVRNLAEGVGASAIAARRQPASRTVPVRKPATRKPATRKPVAPKPAAPRPAVRKAATKRTSTRPVRRTTRRSTSNPDRTDTGESPG